MRKWDDHEARHMKTIAPAPGDANRPLSIGPLEG
jgi:hypothetical protein